MATPRIKHPYTEMAEGDGRSYQACTGCIPRDLVLEIQLILMAKYPLWSSARCRQRAFVLALKGVKDGP